MTVVEICKEYFKAFSNKDLFKLEELFSDNITLRDWEIKEEGRENVLAVNEKIFSGAKDIHVTIFEIYNDGNTVIAELEICIDNSTSTLKVVDILVFDDSNHICSIRAYRG